MSYLKILPVNEKGRDFYIGDLHGMVDLLFQNLDAVKFNYLHDRVISVGDLNDRGPKSFDSLKLIEQPWFHSVLGNHEDMFLDAMVPEFKDRFVQRNIQNGLGWMLETNQDEMMSIVDQVNELPLALQIGDIGVVHAEPPLDWSTVGDLTGYQQQAVIWSRLAFGSRLKRQIQNIGFVVTGHTPIDSPVILGNVINIDTGAVFGSEEYAKLGFDGYLTFIEEKDLRELMKNG